MDSNLHIWEVLIALMIILNSHFQFYAYATSLSFSSGTLITDPLTADSSTATRKDHIRKDHIFQGSYPLHRLSTGGSSTLPSPFQNSSSGIRLPTSNRTASIHTDTKNGDSTSRITPTSTGFQSPPPAITHNSQSFLMAPSSTAPFFIVPTVISTISISIDTTVPQSSTVSAPVVFVTNPSDLNQVVGFKTLQIPESQRTGLPSDVTDNAPAALMIPEICPFPMLLFGFIFVLPVTSSLPAWLSLWVFPFAVKYYPTNTLAGIYIHQLSHSLVWRVIQIGLLFPPREHPQHQHLHPHLPAVRPETG